MRRTILRCLLAATLGGFAVAAPAAAQLPDVRIWRIDDTSRVVNLAIASSGGVSIGAYLAGANWMIAELLKFMRDHPEQRGRFRLPSYRISAMSGASAGNVNALLTALQACDAAPARPAEASALWDVWMQIGLEQLLPRGKAAQSAELGLLDRTFLNTVLKDRLRAEFARPATEGCFIPIVVTMSKLVPGPLSLNRLMSANVQRYVASYAVAAERDAESQTFLPVLRAPERVVALDTALGKQVTLLTGGAGGAYHHIDQVFELVKASSSVTYLFAPLRLTFCDAAEAALAGGCGTEGRAGAREERGRFVDGGVIDNAPLFAAMRLSELREMLHDHSGADGADDAHGTLFVSYDARRERPDGSITPAFVAPAAGVCDVETPRERCGGIGALQQFFGGLLTSGGQYELQWLARLRARDPTLRALDVDLTTRRTAISGEHLMNASAFLARPLREFDFHVGIYDALHFTASAILCLDEHRQPSDSLGPGRCVIDTLRGLVDRFPLSCQSSLAIDLLLRREYGIEWSEALREEQLRSTSHCDDTSVDSRERALAYRSIFEAVTDVAAGTAPPCPRAGLIAGAICREGTAQVLRRLRDDPFFYSYVRREADRCERAVAAAPPDERAGVAARCFATRGFVRMLDDPEGAFFVWIRRMLERAQWLEEEVVQQRTGPKGLLGWDLATQFVNLGVRSALLAEEPGLIAFPTTVPQRRNAWRLFTGLLVPQEYGLEALGNGWSVFWHPLSYRLPNGLAVSTAAGLLRNGFAAAKDANHAGGRKSRFVASLRAGYRPVQRGNPVLSGVMAGVRYYRPSSGDTDAAPSEWDGSYFSPELRFDLLWDRLAVTFTRNPGYGAPSERRDLRAALSITDPGGIVYWVMRSTALR